MTKRIVFPREVLLVEVERRCGEPLCGARARVSLTKAQARAYTGFECVRCGRWYADALSERDIPEWWEELNAASPRGLKPAPEGLKPRRESAGERTNAARNSSPVLKEGPKSAPEVSRAFKDEEECEEDEAEVVARMSREWRRLGSEREAEPVDAEVKRGDSF
ncbi:MAG: hypothetical protein ACJ74Q_23625 [Pyrinomonadaceae bacterium]